MSNKPKGEITLDADDGADRAKCVGRWVGGVYQATATLDTEILQWPAGSLIACVLWVYAIAVYLGRMKSG